MDIMSRRTRGHGLEEYEWPGVNILFSDAEKALLTCGTIHRGRGWLKTRELEILRRMDAFVVREKPLSVIT